MMATNNGETLLNSTHSPAAVVNYFLDLSREQGVPVTHVKIQKLLYLAQGFYLAEEETPLLNEPIEAWKEAIVCASVYYEYRDWGNRCISPVLRNYMCDGTGTKLPKIRNTPQVERHLRRIWECSAHVDDKTLIEELYWPEILDEAKRHGLKRGYNISNDMLKQRFEQLTKGENQ